MSYKYGKLLINEQSNDYTHVAVFDLQDLKNLTAGAAALPIAQIPAGGAIEIAHAWASTPVVGGTTPTVKVGTAADDDAYIASLSISAAAPGVNTGASLTAGAISSVSTATNVEVTIGGVGAGATAGKVFVGLRIFDPSRFVK